MNYLSPACMRLLIIVHSDAWIRSIRKEAETVAKESIANSSVLESRTPVPLLLRTENSGNLWLHGLHAIFIKNIEQDEYIAVGSWQCFLATPYHTSLWIHLDAYWRKCRKLKQWRAFGNTRMAQSFCDNLKFCRNFWWNSAVTPPTSLNSRRLRKGKSSV